MLSAQTLRLVPMVCLFVLTPTLASDALDSCFDLSGSDLNRCLRKQIKATAPAQVLSRVRTLPELRPEVVLSVLDVMKRTLQDEPASIRAEAFELEGRALLHAGSAAAAADAFGRALEVEQGIHRLTWLRRDGSAAWSVELEDAAGRLERFARATIAAGRTDGLDDLLRRVLALGGGAWARAEWEERFDGPVPGSDGAPRSLMGKKWLALLPDVDIALLDGGRFSVADARGRVLILDFWATWCGPCIQELPHLEALYQAEREHGLLAVAVNAREPAQVALGFARDIGLTMPIGHYDDDLDEEFGVKTLPVVMIADRHGRIRARWDGYREGMENALATLTRRLLADDTLPDGAALAQVTVGVNALGVSWSREAAARIDGVTPVSGAAGSPNLMVSAGRSLYFYKADGSGIKRWADQPSSARFVAGPAQADGAEPLVGYRFGGTQIVRYRLPAGDFETIEAPAPVFDVRMLPATSGTVAAPQLVLATARGLLRSAADGTRFETVGGFGTVAGLGSDGGSALSVLETDGTVTRLDAQFDARSKSPVGHAGWGLIEGASVGSGLGVSSHPVPAAVVGRFLESPDEQVAVATAAGQLVLLDRATGAIRFRARWDGIADVDAVDLDGDGRDELVVASGRTLTVLAAAKRPQIETDP